MEVLVDKCSLYSNYLMQSSFLVGVGMAFTPGFLPITRA